MARKLQASSNSIALQQLQGLLETFVEWYKETPAPGMPDPANDVKDSGTVLEGVAEIAWPPNFCLDGRDECHPECRDSLLDCLKSVTQEDLRFKIVPFSRPQEDILEQLGDVFALLSPPVRLHWV